MTDKHFFHFFNTDTCDRCGSTDMVARICSWFTKETICMECSEKEQGVKRVLRARGDDSAMEGCGFVPSI